MNRLAAALLIALSTAVAAPVPAQEDAAPPKEVGVDDKAIMTSQGFLSAHPDLGNRLQGLDSLENKNFKRALDDFRRAARYGDKPSQGVIAEMYWNGQGVEADRATAYAWMDLAAERAYPSFVAFRERYWSALTPAERERATTVGEPLYAEYGDAVAKPRMERVLRKRRMHITGSHAGYVNGAMQVVVQDGNSERGRNIPAFRFYQPRYWLPRNYYEWQDEIFERPANGIVEIGPIGTPEAAGGPDE